MTKRTNTTNTTKTQMARWLEIVGATGQARRGSLPVDKPVYRI